MIGKFLRIFGYEKVSTKNKLVGGLSIKKSNDPAVLRGVASHEIGHLLVYLALPETPKDIKVQISVEEHGEVSGGITCSLDFDCNQARSIRVLEWLMLINLGGVAAEIVDESIRSVGCGFDMEKWLELAIHYHRTFATGIFFSNPTSSAELEFNEKKLMAMQKGQIQFLTVFIKSNKRIHNEITERLMEMKVLKECDLVEYKAKIHFPKDFPMPA